MVDFLGQEGQQGSGSCSRRFPSAGPSYVRRAQQHRTDNHVLHLPLSILEISFQSEELQNLCIDESIADERFGTVAAEGLRNRLSDIRAADSIHELLAGRPQRIRLGDQDGYRLEIEPGIWLTVVPNHIKPRVDADGRHDWSRVRRVRVVAVGN